MSTAVKMQHLRHIRTVDPKCGERCDHRTRSSMQQQCLGLKQRSTRRGSFSQLPRSLEDQLCYCELGLSSPDKCRRNAPTLRWNSTGGRKRPGARRQYCSSRMQGCRKSGGHIRFKEVGATQGQRWTIAQGVLVIVTLFRTAKRFHGTSCKEEPRGTDPEWKEMSTAGPCTLADATHQCAFPPDLPRSNRGGFTKAKRRSGRSAYVMSQKS